jgi:hypothetical protein
MNDFTLQEFFGYFLANVEDCDKHIIRYLDIIIDHHSDICSPAIDELRDQRDLLHLMMQNKKDNRLHEQMKVCFIARHRLFKAMKSKDVLCTEPESVELQKSEDDHYEYLKKRAQR